MSTASNRPIISSEEIRNIFLDFFKNKQHQIVASSSLVPGEDPTLLFTNAGMNQFKDVFLGFDQRHYARATSSQKCVRAGGKHNDLENVGYTARHHTFFEMLGNWSFGNYKKETACRLAIELLVDIYKINPKGLFFSYFGGDKNLNLEPDLETKAIWLKLGIKEDHILPFGMKENFWEMDIVDKLV